MFNEAVFDYSKAYPKAHNYTLKKLKEKFGPKGHCTLLDYATFYAEGLELFNEGKSDENGKETKCPKCKKTTKQMLRGYTEKWDLFKCMHCGNVYKPDKPKP